MSDRLNLLDEALGLRVDVRRMGLDPDETDGPAVASALASMAALEAGAIANPDEGRQVGHYWLRAPALAPEPQGAAIEAAIEQVLELASSVRASSVFDHVIVTGIGGSALGTQLVLDALVEPTERIRVVFIDNTDPDGIDRTLAGLDLGRSLLLFISKSGGTQEIKNGLAELRLACAADDLDFAARAIAVTCPDSALDRVAAAEGWRARVPLWDWVGGRTSVTSAVGLLPAALAGVDVRAFLAGAAEADAWTRQPSDNPAVLLALAWHHAGGGRGDRNMVVLPYKDRLLLLSRHLQQLVMESLGKKHDLQGRVVHQGITVYGNKGTTDQHAFVQQLRGGRDDFFVNFVAVLEHRVGPSALVGPDATSGDYLIANLLGTRRALTEAGRPSLTVSLRRLDARSLGALIALYERAVGLYGSLIGVNAYHQPGVEAGKKAAEDILALQHAILAGDPVSPSDDAEMLREQLEVNGRL